MNRRLINIMFFICMNFFQLALIGQIESNFHNKVLNASAISVIYPNSISINPAPSNLRNFRAGFYISPSKLGISELNYGTAFAELPLDSNWVSTFDITGSGSELFSEVIPAVGICYFDDQFSLAIKGKYNQITIRDFNNEGVFLSDIGANFRIIDNYYAGFALTNIFGSSFEGAEFNSNQTAVLGIGTHLSENLSADINYILYLNYFGTASFSISYKFDNMLSTALSFQGNPAITQLDLLFDTGGITLPISISYFDLFGFAFSLGFVYEIN